jgi:hypothetical protein
MAITKYTVARTANEASRFWNTDLCRDSKDHTQAYRNRRKLLRFPGREPEKMNFLSQYFS